MFNETVMQQATRHVTSSQHTATRDTRGTPTVTLFPGGVTDQGGDPGPPGAGGDARHPGPGGPAPPRSPPDQRLRLRANLSGLCRL